MEDYRMSMKKVGIFGGTFDPIHFGHINLALHLKEKLKLQEVLFVPAFINPLKVRKSDASCEARQKMLELALQGIEGMIVCPLEIERKSSYMIDTVRTLQEEQKYRDAKFYLLMGEDQISDFERWKEAEGLSELATPIIGVRALEPSPRMPRDPHLLKTVQEGLRKIPLFDISATEIRGRLKKGLFCGHLVCERVLQYIEEKALYGRGGK
jgi:nicotinate-nucleotide adenylyltransferase